MRHNKLWVLTVSLVFMMAFGAVAQKSKTQKPAKKSAVQKDEKSDAARVSQNEEKVKDLVTFVEYVGKQFDFRPRQGNCYYRELCENLSRWQSSDRR